MGNLKASGKGILEVYRNRTASRWMAHSGEVMELNEQVNRIQSKADLVEFIEILNQDLKLNPTEWENHTLERYLSALASWLEDSDGFYKNHNRPIPVSPSWKNIAEMLIAAKMYE